MRDINTLGKAEYIVGNIYWGGIAMLCYRMLLFQRLPSFSKTAGEWLFWVAVTALLAGGIRLTFRRRRNHLSMLINVLVPLESYAAVSYWEQSAFWILLTLGVAAALSLLYFALVVFRRIHTPNSGTVLCRRVCHALLGARTIAGLCLLTFLLGQGILVQLRRVDLLREDGCTLGKTLEEFSWTDWMYGETYYI